MLPGPSGSWVEKGEYEFADGEEERHSRQSEKPGQEVWKFIGAGARGGLDSL